MNRGCNFNLDLGSSFTRELPMSAIGDKEIERHGIPSERMKVTAELHSQLEKQLE